MDACISNNFIFIFFIIMKSYCKVKKPETEVAEGIRKFIYSEIATLRFFERSGIALTCFMDSIRAVWTRSLSTAKIFSEQHLFTKCEHGLRYRHRNSMNKIVEKIYKYIIIFC